MPKRGDIVINYTVMLVLAIAVLLVVLVIFTKGYEVIFDKVRWALRFVLNLSPAGM